MKKKIINYTKKSFLKGMARSIDLGCTLGKPNTEALINRLRKVRILTEEEAMISDWTQTGRDLKSGLNKFAVECSNGQS